MDILALLVVLMVGVILGYLLQNPALAERQREVKLMMRHAKALLAKAELHEDIAQDKLRFVQGVRAQTCAMLDAYTNAPVLDMHPALSGPAPIFEGMHNWLASTGVMPQIEAPAEVPELEPTARERFATKPPAKPRRKPRVTVTVGEDVRSVEMAEVTS